MLRVVLHGFCMAVFIVSNSTFFCLKHTLIIPSRHRAEIKINIKKYKTQKTPVLSLFFSFLLKINIIIA